jgi:NADH-quinone oxidoreductase subunit J
LISQAVLFYGVAILALAGSAGVVFAPKPVHAVLSLLAVMFAVGVAFFALGSPLLAAMQIIIYAGAVVVLFLFVVMLIDMNDVLPAFRGGNIIFPILSIAGVAVLTGALIAVLVWGGLPAAVAPPSRSPADLGRHLFTTHLALFELISILLTAAAVGVVGLTRSERP